MVRSSMRKTPWASDEALIQACLDGCELAWHELVERYARLVYSVPVRYRLQFDEAEEVCQRTFAILFRRLQTVRDPDRLSGWLITTAHRECYQVLRARRAAAPPVSAELLEWEGPPEERVEAWENQRLVREALRRLGGREQRLLEALFLDPSQPDYEQIARSFEMPVGSIGPTRARALRKLETILRTMGFCGAAAAPSETPARRLPGEALAGRERPPRARLDWLSGPFQERASGSGATGSAPAREAYASLRAC